MLRLENAHKRSCINNTLDSKYPKLKTERPQTINGMEKRILRNEAGWWSIGGQKILKCGATGK